MLRLKHFFSFCSAPNKNTLKSDISIRNTLFKRNTLKSQKHIKKILTLPSFQISEAQHGDIVKLRCSTYKVIDIFFNIHKELS